MKYLPCLLFAFVVAGCQSEPGLSQKLDAASTTRLAAVSASDKVLVAVHLHPLPQPMPGLVEGARELVRVTDAALIELPREALDTWSPPGLERAAVWGSAESLGKLDGTMRRNLLEAWVTAPGEPMSLIARFLREATGIEESVTGCGATSRTVAGPIATIDATPEAVLCLMARDDVVGLSSPRPLRPNR